MLAWLEMRKAAPEVFNEPLPKGFCRFPHVLIIIFQPVTFIPVYYSTCLSDVILVIWCYYKGFDGIPTTEMDLYTYLDIYVLIPFAKTLGVGNHHTDLVVVIVSLLVMFLLLLLPLTLVLHCVALC